MRLSIGFLVSAALATVFLSSAAEAQKRKKQPTLGNICARGEVDARIRACTELIKRGGRDAETYYYHRSSAYFSKGDCERSYADAEKALSLKRDGYNFGRLAWTLFECNNDADGAITNFNEAIRALPKDTNYHIGRGRAYVLKQDFERALQDFNQAIRLDPRNPNSYFQRGVLWYLQEDFDKAVADYDRAIEMNPSHASAHSFRGLAFSRKGEDRKALADFDRAIGLAPETANFYDNRAFFYARIEDYERAMADHDKAIALLPRYNFYTARASTWRLRGDLNKALADANEAVRLETGTRSAQQFRGYIYRYLGEYDRAIADFDEALRKRPDHAETYVARGITYEKKGDHTRARADFERALKARGSDFRTAHENARAQLAALDAAAPAATPKATAPSIAADQGRRVALVIGNSDYTHAAKLTNPARDAQAVAASLRAVGFETVMVGNDLSREKLIGRLREFAREAEKADWAMVYYAGHGIEVGGVNYLIPVDARLEADRDTTFEAVSLEQVLTAVESARKIKLVVLDACRDNPFAAQMRRTNATRSMSRGLSRVEPEGATLVVYAAKHGQTALDGDGANSPFAAAFVKRMATPGIEINKIFRLVRDDVMDTTAGRQEPFTYGSLPGREDFYFVTR
jgi:tetratricopeptide (TPR) repeat protein